MQENHEKMKEKKEREKKVKQEKSAVDISVSDNEGYSEIAQRTKSVDRRPKKPESLNEKIDVVKSPELSNIPMKSNAPRKVSANVVSREKMDRKESFEELKSVEQSARTNKSGKSPAPASNNIFLPPKSANTPVQKKNVMEFSKPSNRQLIKNAVTNVCLAGEPNRKEREEVVAKLNEIKTDANFIIVFKAISGRQV